LTSEALERLGGHRKSEPLPQPSFEKQGLSVETNESSIEKLSSIFSLPGFSFLRDGETMPESLCDGLELDLGEATVDHLEVVSLDGSSTEIFEW